MVLLSGLGRRGPLRVSAARILKGLLASLLALYVWWLVYSAHLVLSGFHSFERLPTAKLDDVVRITHLEMPAHAALVEGYREQWAGPSGEPNYYLKLQMPREDAQQFMAQKRLAGAETSYDLRGEDFPARLRHRWRDLDDAEARRCWTVDLPNKGTLWAVACLGDPKMTNVYVMVHLP